MTKEKLIETLDKNHKDFLNYIISLTDTEFTRSQKSKWTPGQQLEHIYLCLKPLSQALSSKIFIEQKFGTIKRTTYNYDEVISKYKAALTNGGKAPEKFLPAKVELGRKTELLNNTNEILRSINNSLHSYTEVELNSLVLPHPLLGELTLQEMFYLMAFHATHHLNQAKENLKIN